MKILFLTIFMTLGLFSELCAMEKKGSAFSQDPEQRERVRKAYEQGLESARQETREFFAKLQNQKQNN